MPLHPDDITALFAIRDDAIARAQTANKRLRKLEARVKQLATAVQPHTFYPENAGLIADADFKWVASKEEFVLSWDNWNSDSVTQRERMRIPVDWLDAELNLVIEIAVARRKERLEAKFQQEAERRARVTPSAAPSGYLATFSTLLRDEIKPEVKRILRELLN